MSHAIIQGQHPAAPAPGDVTRGMRDGVEVHKAALACGFTTRLLPRQVLQVFTPEGARTAFTHGIPQGSSLSGVTFTQDLRMRRGLLGKAGVPQPRGATFSVGRSRGAALRYAETIGYPVVVKPALGDSTIDVTRGIQNQGQFAAAVDRLLTPPEDRPDSTQAAYGITELRKPGRKDGRVTVPPGYRFLVEEEVRGEYLRLLVIDGAVVDVLACPGGPWSGRATDASPRPGSRTALEQTAAAVVAALPGLAVLSIDVVLSAVFSAQPVVVDVSERPWLDVQNRMRPARVAGLARDLLASGLSGTTLPPSRPDEFAEFHVMFEGVVAPGEFASLVTDHGAAHGATIDLKVADPARGHVAGTVRGTPATTAELVEIILNSGIHGQTAMKAEIVPREVSI